MSEIGPTETRNLNGNGGVLLVCEHASNRIPMRYAGLGLDPAALEAHIAWDPGAIGVARALSDLLDAPLIASTVSRLVYDCNRAPDQASAMPEQSETYVIAGNQSLTAAERVKRTEEVYLPFQSALGGQLGRMLARGERPIIVTIHSFTPVWFGTPRQVQFGIIHDQDDAFARALARQAAADGKLAVALNEPYSAADGVAHTLRLHATPHGLAHAMLELRNDLIATPEAQTQIAAWLAPLLRRAAEGLS